MPLYSYRCKRTPAHDFDARVQLDMSDEPHTCPVLLDPADPRSACYLAVERVFPLPARHFPGADSWRSKKGV